MPVKPIPDEYPGVTPYLVVNGAADAIEFYKKVFGAQEIMRFPGPGGRVGHAELRIGKGLIMLADENLEMGAKSAQSLGGSPVGLLVYFEKVDAVVERAASAGAKVLRPVQDQFYGDRSGTIEDPYGHNWTIATHVEDVSPEEMTRRMGELMKQKGAH